MPAGQVESLFVDTNVLIYANLREAPQHTQSRTILRSLHEAGTRLWISRQVLREYLAVVTRPGWLADPMSRERAVEHARRFEHLFAVAEDTAAVTTALYRLLLDVPVAGKQIHDANIVATMLSFGIPALLTHNVTDFARFQGKIDILPLDSGRRAE